MEIQKLAHQYFYDIMKEFYHCMIGEKNMFHYVMNENKKLYSLIKNKNDSQEKQVFESIVEEFKDKFPFAEFFLIEDIKPSLTLVFKMNGPNDEEVSVYFSICLMSNCYCYFVQTKGSKDKRLYFQPIYEYADLHNDVGMVISSKLPEFVNVPYVFLRYGIRFIVPGNQSSFPIDLELGSNATIMDALFFNFDFEQNFTILHDAEAYKSQFEILDISDPELLERVNFFTKVPKPRLISIE
ncbi:MAG: hypothetical protein ABIV51_12860 [Saprospiraceae bacterium]